MTSRFFVRSGWATCLGICLSMAACADAGEHGVQIDLSGLGWSVAEGFQADYVTTIPKTSVKQTHTPIAPNTIFDVKPGPGLVEYTIFCIFPGVAFEGADPPVLFLPGLGDNFEIYLNGRRIAKEWYVTGDAVSVHRTSMGYSVPLDPSLLKPAGNLLVFRVAAPRPAAQGVGGVPGLFYGGGYRIASSTRIQRDSDETASIALMSLYLGFGLYHMILFLGRRRDRFNLYFALFSIGVFTYFFSRTGFAYARVLDTSHLSKIEHVSLPLLLPFLFLFLQSYFYPTQPIPIWMRSILILDVLIAGIVLLVPPQQFYYPIEIWKYTHLPLGLLLPPFFLGRALLWRARDAAKLSLGIVLLYLAAGWDIVNTVFVIRSMNPLFEYGFFSFVMSQVATLAQRFAILENERDGFIRELDAKNATLLQLDKMKDRFLASTSHELRTPLHGIIGLADSLLMGAAGSLSDAARQNLAMIIQSGRRLSSLVDEILDFSRLQGGNVRLLLQGINLQRLTESVLVMLRPLVRTEDVTLINAVPSEIALVEADESRLQQIMINLVGNAIKFTKQGHIQVSAHNVDGTVTVSVEDTGIGIPEEKQAAIFEYFEQGHESAGTQYGGAGLGLSISRELVQLHGGTLSVKSQKGKGSTFTFTLPSSRRPAQNETMETKPTLPQARLPVSIPHPDLAVAPAPSVPADAPVVLAVDDEPVNLQVLTNVLATAGFRTATARNGAEALSFFEGGNVPDIVLLDVMMPGISGYELCQILRERFSVTELPIILLTARNRSTDIVEGLKSGANDYLTKPFESVELLARVGNLCDLKRSSSEREHLVTLRQELKIAGTIQSTILPDSVPQIEGFGVHAFYRPKGAVGGDFYDFYSSGPGQITALISDVSGHGVPAALGAAMVKVAFWVEIDKATQPAELLRGVNRWVYGRIGNQFITAGCVHVDRNKGLLTYAAAGHPALFLHRAEDGTVLEVSSRGQILGWMSDIASTPLTIGVNPKDRIVLVTDGALELRNNTGDLFGWERLKRSIQETPPGDSVGNRILDDLMLWSGKKDDFDDDIAIVTIELA